MHESLLSSAAIPAPTKVLGMLMRPYSLGHELFLIREQNPMVDWNAMQPFPARESLFEAALICCNSWEQNKRTVFDPLSRLKAWIWSKRISSCNWNLEAMKFSAYRQNGSIEFPISEIVDPNSSTPRSPGAPFTLRLQQWIMLSMRLTESEAWDYPYGLAVMRWTTFWEEQGGLHVKNAGEMEFDEFVRTEELKDQEAANA